MQEDTKRWDDSLISLGLGALVVVVSGILLYNYFSDQTPKILQNQTENLASASPVAQIAESSGSAVAQVTPIAFSAVSTSKPTLTPVATAIPTIKPIPTVQPTVASTVKPAATELPTVAPTQIAQVAVTATPTVAPTIAAVASPTPIVDQDNGTKTLPTKYSVVKGDTLWDLSEKFYGTGFEWKKIAQANNMTNGKGIDVGMVIEIPKNEMISATSTDKPSTAVAPIPTTTPANVGQNSGSTIGALPNAVQQGFGIVNYTIVKGDSLWKIAGEKCSNHYAWSSIAKQNKVAAPSVIHAGNTLTFTCQ